MLLKPWASNLRLYHPPPPRLLQNLLDTLICDIAGVVDINGLTKAANAPGSALVIATTFPIRIYPMVPMALLDASHQNRVLLAMLKTRLDKLALV